MMNIKKLDPYKELFVEALDGLPIQAMEEDIKGSSDSLISGLYVKLKYAINETKDSRYKKIYHKLGICLIYSLIDPIYGDPVRWILHEVKISSFYFNEKPPRLWRVNNTHKSGMR